MFYKRNLLLLLLAFFATIVSAQQQEECQDLRKRLLNNCKDSFASNELFHIEIKEGKPTLNYITPLKRTYSNRVKYTFADNSWNCVTSALSMVGADKDVLSISKKSNLYQDSIYKRNSTVEEINNISTIDDAALLNSIDTNKVIMINEAHDRVQPRAFLLYLLPLLKARGYTYLAMETLNRNNTNEISYSTGYYTTEPMFGEVAREALRLGCTLIPYEDSNAAKHTNLERETAQAFNLWNAIKAAPETAKFIVIAGYGHIMEDIPNDMYRTMAMEFKKISGINPFTIDEFYSLEESGYANHLPLAKDTRSPEIILNNNNNILTTNPGHYDAFIIHPKTQYKNCRPTWLTCNGIKKEYKIKCDNKKAILIQAYYANEVTSTDAFNTRIPADQTFYLDKNSYCHLFLIPKNDYIIVFRDDDNNIIYKKPFHAK